MKFGNHNKFNGLNVSKREIWKFYTFISHSHVKVSYQRRNRDLRQRSKCCITSEITNWDRRGSVLVKGITLDNPARVSKSHLDSANKWRMRLRTFGCYLEMECNSIGVQDRPVFVILSFKEVTKVLFIQEDTYTNCMMWQELELTISPPSIFFMWILFLMYWLCAYVNDTYSVSINTSRQWTNNREMRN